MSTLFSLINVLVLPVWLAMIVAPNWRVTRAVVASPLVLLPNMVIYAVLVLPRVPELVPAFGSLATVAALLGTPFGAAVVWAHVLAFDLFVGRWIFLDNARREHGGLHPVVMAVILVLGFMFGPLGYLVYLGVTTLTDRQVRRQAALPAA